MYEQSTGKLRQLNIDPQSSRMYVQLLEGPWNSILESSLYNLPCVDNFQYLSVQRWNRSEDKYVLTYLFTKSIQESYLLSAKIFIAGQHCLIINIIIIEEIKTKYIKRKTFRFKKMIIIILALMLWTKVISFNNKNKTNLMRMSCYQSIVLVSTEQRSVWQIETLTSSWSQNYIRSYWGQLWFIFYKCSY